MQKKTNQLKSNILEALNFRYLYFLIFFITFFKKNINTKIFGIFLYAQDFCTFKKVTRFLICLSDFQEYFQLLEILTIAFVILRFIEYFLSFLKLFPNICIFFNICYFSQKNFFFSCSPPLI